MKRVLIDWKTTALLVMLFVGGATSELVVAQTRGGFGSQPNQTGAFGGIGQSQFGATNRTGIGGAQTGLSQQNRFGQTGGVGQGRGVGGFGGQGARGVGAGGFGQPLVGGQDGFVGADAQQLRTQNRDPRAQRRAMFDFAIESLNEIRESRSRERSRRNRKPPVRVQLRPLFSAPQVSATQLTSRVSTQLDRSLPSSSGDRPQVTVSGRTATIEGTVGSDYDKQLAAKMLSLQPGISQVENRLTVESSTAPAELLLTPAR